MTFEIVQILKKSGDAKVFENMLSLLLASIKTKTEKLSSSPKDLLPIRNYVIFFMILVLNLKEFPSLIKIIFEGQFFKNLCKILSEKKQTKNKMIFDILSQIFLDEYKKLFLREDNKDPQLEKIFINQQSEFSKMWPNTMTFYNDEIYINMLEILNNFDISYSNLPELDKIKDEEKPEYKLRFVQSIIRVIFSREKKRFSNDNFSELDLLKKIIDKDMKDTKTQFGDYYKTLFRKEDLLDNIIKYIFFIFGNSMIIDSFVKPLKKMMNQIGMTKDRVITKDEFESLTNEIIDNMSKTIPDILKLLLKILYESINKHFTINKDNYRPLYTCLIFNFFINTRIQIMYSIDPINYVFVESFNRLLRNTCFNCKYAEGDALYSFNDKIESLHKKMNDFIEEKIISIKIDDRVKTYLKELFTEKYLLFPKFLFYLDSQFIVSIYGEDKLISCRLLPPDF